MLNLVAFDAEYDSERLESSYNAIQNKDFLEIIINDSERENILKKINETLTTPAVATRSLQNLFKLTLQSGQFYIAQCLINFDFSASSISRQFSLHKYNFQIVGIADTIADFGKTFMRAETKTDKIIGQFFGNDIDFPGTKEFNDKYYLISDTKEAVVSNFDKTFLNTLAKYADLILIIKGKEIFITFETELEEEHSKIIEDVLSNCEFLTTNYGM